MFPLPLDVLIGQACQACNSNTTSMIRSDEHSHLGMAIHYLNHLIQGGPLEHHTP